MSKYDEMSREKMLDTVTGYTDDEVAEKMTEGSYRDDIGIENYVGYDFTTRVHRIKSDREELLGEWYTSEEMEVMVAEMDTVMGSFDFKADIDRTTAVDDFMDEAKEAYTPEPSAPPTVMTKLKGSVKVPEEFKFSDDNTFYTMLRNIYRGKNILITGPSGCGKSSLGKILADITNKPYYAFNFGDTMNPSAKLLGDTKFNQTEGTWFKPSRFVSALMDDRGAFMMLDEVTRDRTGDLGNILMPVLDGQKYLALDESDTADTVKIDEGAFFFAPANIGREYLGASHDLDRAWKDRFTGGIYELDYLPQKKEQELIELRVAGIDTQDAYRITDFAQRIRNLYKSEELSCSVSTRMCLSVAEFVVDGMELIDALQQVCLPFYPIQAGDDTERVRVIQTIQSMGD